MTERLFLSWLGLGPDRMVPNRLFLCSCSTNGLTGTFSRTWQEEGRVAMDPDVPAHLGLVRSFPGLKGSTTSWEDGGSSPAAKEQLIWPRGALPALVQLPAASSHVLPPLSTTSDRLEGSDKPRAAEGF